MIIFLTGLPARSYIVSVKPSIFKLDQYIFTNPLLGFGYNLITSIPSLSLFILFTSLRDF